MKTRQLLISMILAIPSISSLAWAEQTESASRFAALIGVHDWGGLADLQSADGGRFESTGVNFQAEWHGHVTDFQHSALLLGGELGFFTNDSSIQGLTSELISRGMYVMPSLKLAFGRQRNLYLDAGAGLYVVDFAEVDCGYGYCAEMDDVWEETTFAGYLGISADLRISQQWAMALEVKIHFVSFGAESGLGAEPQKLDGPIYMFQLGAAFR